LLVLALKWLELVEVWCAANLPLRRDANLKALAVLFLPELLQVATPSYSQQAIVMMPLLAAHGMATFTLKTWWS
jgi:hypothetical protein